MADSHFCRRCGAARPHAVPCAGACPQAVEAMVPGSQEVAWKAEPVVARAAGAGLAAGVLQNAPQVSQSQPSSFAASPGPPKGYQNARQHPIVSNGSLPTGSPSVAHNLREALGFPRPMDPLGDGYRDRRPTDPFFYPTTVSPLTGAGLHLIQETTPPLKREEAFPDVKPSLGPALEPDMGSGLPSVPTPLRSFIDHPEDMSLLQKQNDELARHMQDLERAKSLAQVTCAQNLQKIRNRQEQLKREAEISLQKYKEAQAELGLPLSPFPSGTPSAPSPQPENQDGQAALKEQDMAISRCAAAAAALQVEHPAFGHERVQPGQAGCKQFSEDASSTLPTRPAIASNPTDATICESAWRAVEPPELQRPSACQDSPSRRPQVNDVNSLGLLDSAQELLRPPGSTSMGARMTPERGSPDSREDSFLAEGPQSPDTSAMANHYLSKHMAPGHGESDTGTSNHYVDALGRRLEGMKPLDDLPNIKDSAPPGDGGLASALASRHTSAHSAVQSASAEPLGVVAASRASSRGASASSSAMPQVSDSGNLDPSSRRELVPVSARGSTANSMASADRPVVLVAAHERAPGSARAGGGSTAERQGSLGSAASAVGSSGAGHGGQREEACGGGLGASGLGNSRGASSSRPLRGESSADRSQRTNRRKSSDEGMPPQGPPQGISEEQQVELDECLDTVRVCASSVTRESLRELEPAPVVKHVLEAVSLLLGQHETRWDKLKQLISKPAFYEKLQRLDFQRTITSEQFRKVRDKLANPQFDEEHLKTVCVPVVPLAMWCRAIGVFLSKTKYRRSGPEIRPLAGAGTTTPQQPRSRQASSQAAMQVSPDLSSLSPEELRRVQDLTISCQDVGTITFHGETDCTGLDIESVVRLQIGEVLVYPKAHTKPEIGVGLNKAATVTMFQCWPPAGSRDLEDPAGQEEYRMRIKAMTEEKKAKFIDYDCNTGVWKFAVDHF